MTFCYRLPSPSPPSLLSPSLAPPPPRPLSLQIESHRLTFREKAKARTDHGADIVVASKPPTLPSSTSASDSPASPAPPQPPALPAALPQQGL